MRWLALLVCAFGALGCAGQECDFHSQCGDLHYCERGRCEQDCRASFDCADGQQCNALGQCVAPFDAGPPQGDAGHDDGGLPPIRDAGFDASRPIDAGRDAGRDAGPDAGRDSGRIDAGTPMGTGRYLDRCASAADCASGRCVDDVGGSRMCTIACVTHRDCASEHACANGSCVPDDTGASCSTSSPASCALGLCVGNASTGTGHCTRECANASDCPAGFGCGDAGGTRVCVEIERGCTAANQCVTGLCLPIQGCTVECRTPADCPRRFGFLPPYACAVAFGSTNPICVPPEDIVGPDPAGAACRIDASLNVLCRSGACDEGAPAGPMCTQACTEEGGCGPGLGCWPSVEDGGILLYCTRAGSRALGAACTSGRECDSGLCDATGFCTRLCTDDGLCPTGMRCDPVPGYGISMCRR